jgi:hypothetical protein
VSRIFKRPVYHDTVDFLLFYGVQSRIKSPDRNFEAGRAIRHTLYRNPDTGEVGAVENRSAGVCKVCAILMLQQRQHEG